MLAAAARDKSVSIWQTIGEKKNKSSFLLRECLLTHKTIPPPPHRDLLITECNFCLFCFSSTAGDKSPEKVSSPTGSTSSAGGSWWGSWLDTAKSKSASVLEAVKNDLTELTTVVKTEATSATEALGRSLSLTEPDSTVGAMKKSFSSFLGQVTEALVPSLEEDEEAEEVLITEEGAETLTGFYRHLAELQSMDTTYLEEPADELSEKYKRWMEVVEQEQFTEPRLARHLASSTILNEQYVALVPAKVAHMDFWKR